MYSNRCRYRPAMLLLGAVLLLVPLSGCSDDPVAPTSSNTETNLDKNRPTIETLTVYDSFVAADCGDYQVVDDYRIDIRVRHWTDDQGVTQMAIETYSFHDTFRNTANGFEATGIGHTVYIDRVNDQGFTIQGSGFNITVPGHGVITADSGHTVYAVVEDDVVIVQNVGHFSFDSDIICEAMAGD
jgi:hypothetical protein